MSSSTGEKTFVLPNGNKATIDDLIELLKEEFRIPIPNDVEINSIDQIPKSLKVKWSLTNLERVEKINFATDYFLNYDNSTNQISSIEELPGLNELNNEQASITSESGQLKICINSKSTKNEKSANQTIDIWNLKSNTLLNSIDIDDAGKHGTINLNPYFSSLSFSPDENKLMYVAEKKNKTESYFKDKKLFKQETKDKSNDEIKEKGNEYEYRQEWGEQLVGISHTCACILTLKPKYSIKIIDLPNLSIAKPFWIDNDQIGFIAYDESPKKIGLVFCTNMVNFLYKCKLTELENEKDEFKILRGENNDLNITNPQINQQRDKVVFFENPAGQLHFQASRIKLWDLKTNEITTVFNLIEENQTPNSLFLNNHVHSNLNYWLNDGRNIVLVAENGSKNNLYMLNVLTKKLELIEFDLDDVNILGLKNNLLVVVGSSPNQIPVVKITRVDENKAIKFYQLHSNYPTLNDKITYRLIKQNEDKPMDQIETIVIGLSDKFNSPSPAIIIPHGGPHVSYTLSYYKSVSFYAKLGFKVCLINYRGSLNINNQYVSQLCGNVGDMDVKDCMSAINNLINLNLIDKNNISLYGGSHGGFIVCHLIGQYPDFGFRSCCAANPVTDMSKMIGTTDIPEWTIVESFGLNIDTYKKLNNLPEENNLVMHMRKMVDVGKPKLLETMFEKSPINHIDKVKTPLLMLLGKIDLRVPHYQGLTYANGLKVRGVETKINVYPDNHSISKTEHNSDFILSITKWILEHLSLN